MDAEMTAWNRKHKDWLGRRDPRERRPSRKPAPQQQPSDEELPGVVEVPVRCPRCGSKDNIVTSTRPPVRYRKCRDCGQNFKSTEESEPDEPENT